MKVLIQWALSSPENWEEIDSSEFSSLPAKQDPTGLGLAVNNTKGWINRICCQGVEFTADHYWVEDLPNGDCRIVIWNDDLTNYPDSYAHEWIFSLLDFDANLNGAVNTKQIHRIYAESSMHAIWQAETPYNKTELKTWTDFVVPTAPIHGINLSDALYAQHESIRTVHGWREWTEGLPADEIVNNKVRAQRNLGRYVIPDGTRTYYHNPSAGVAPHIADNNNSLGLAPEGLTLESSGNIGGGGDVIAFTAITPANEPSSAAWPTGNYRYQIDCSTVGADLTYGLLNRGASVGHFGRTDSAGVHLESFPQIEGAFTGTGLKLATTGSVSWTAGAATDRFAVILAASRPAAHGQQQIELELGEIDDFADGPWAAAGPAAGLRTFGLTGVGV